MTEKRLVPAIDRAVAIMDLFADNPRALGVSEVARLLDLPKSSAHGICETLASLGLLQANPLGYTLGGHALRWGYAYLSRTSLVQSFHAQIEQNPMLRGYTVTLSMLDGNAVVYLACRNADRPLGFTFQAGHRLPAAFTATGKAMLAAMPDPEWQAILAGPWPAALTRNSVADRAALARQLGRWRQLNYAVDEGEIREGMVCLGTAVLDQSGRPVAGIAVSLTATEAREPVRAELGRSLAAVAAVLAQ